MPEALKPGKLSFREMKVLLSELLPGLGEEVLVPPGIGLDAGVVRLTENLGLAFTSDPITAASEEIGYYAVHVNANDIAAIGGDPKWMTVDLFLPLDSPPELPRKVLTEIKDNLRAIGASLIGGHTEVTPGIDRVMVAGTMVGVVNVERLTPSSNAKAGDLIVLTKWGGLEGTSIIAKDKREELMRKGASQEALKEGSQFIRFLSVLPEAKIARELAPHWVHAMHDPTEGGVLGGVFEMAVASNLGFELWRDEIPFQPLTLHFCELFHLDPLKLISSGALLIAISPEGVDLLGSALKSKGINWKVIGKFLEDPDARYLISKGRREEASYPERDEIWKLFE